MLQDFNRFIVCMGGLSVLMQRMTVNTMVLDKLGLIQLSKLVLGTLL